MAMIQNYWLEAIQLRDKDKSRRHNGMRCAVKMAIHGLSNEFRWLEAAHRLRLDGGYIALTGSAMKKIWRPVRVGTSVKIRGTYRGNCG